MITILRMALGGCMSGWIYNETSIYQLFFVNGSLWNGFNIAILLLRNQKAQCHSEQHPLCLEERCVQARTLRF